MRSLLSSLLLASILWLSCCASNTNDATTVVNADSNSDPQANGQINVAVTAVSVSGTEGNYTFSVTIASTDTGCDQYADWWEVISPGGELIFRRVLGHSHVDEQPFTRSGSGISITETQQVFIRAHMNPSGYGVQSFEGSVSEGFFETTLDADFSIELEEVEPLPENCAF